MQSVNVFLGHHGQETFLKMLHTMRRCSTGVLGWLKERQKERRQLCRLTTFDPVLGGRSQMSPSALTEMRNGGRCEGAHLPSREPLVRYSGQANPRLVRVVGCAGRARLAEREGRLLAEPLIDRSTHREEIHLCCDVFERVARAIALNCP